MQPVDQIGWVTQSRITHQDASGEIVFIGSDVDLANPANASARRDLANVVRNLDAAGADAVFVDFAFSEPTTAAIDGELNAALREFSGSAYLVRDVTTDLNGAPTLQINTPAIARDVDTVAFEAWVNYLGYTWQMPFVSEETGERLPNFSAQLAGVPRSSDDDFQVNYAFEMATLPTYQLSRLLDGSTNLDIFADKTLVVGPTLEAIGRARNVPGYPRVAESMVAIYGAETLKEGAMRWIEGWMVLTGVAFALLLIIGLKSRAPRYALYVLLVLALPSALLITGYFGVRMSVAGGALMLFIFGLYRARSRWTRNLLLVDADTDLPTFAALEADHKVADNAPAIIVAKIHRFEEVRRTLPGDLHADYLLAINGRLKAATQDATIYLGQGHLIAWTMQERDPAVLRDHLEGLRALFSSPLAVADNQVDVGITFGIDITPSANVSKRLNAAVAAAEKTNETFEPIAIADTTSQEDLIWNISLQARIDAALANGEIYLAFQPKIMVQSGEIIGAEALVRWDDPIKGQIPPDHFIRQCETAGRMSQLTRFVLEEACAAGNAFGREGLDLPIAVNVSATLLHERAIVQMVAEVLEATGFEPQRLTLEITETYRISNLDLAAEILGELDALGCKISMDDFGVGAASLEALLKLPFSELKIDRMFIAPMTESPKALGIVKSVLKMGKDLRIIVVAEGVENAGTLTLLRESGCLVAQGYAISRPVPFEKILAFHRDKARAQNQNMV
ncbi:diguanylate cyclase/phosphodiesterase (GGDEF & EAL domains) with PAS/PAC sensor(s) [Aurantiacibacter gangjinensis]|nr:diguanylate cyclase/phosphodiesterase (GGDEF & EAL domains) with PAS/PAC sensor(s) [Aurantiacibacter gangjinensis]